MLVEQKQPNMGRRGLVVGNYCHDVLIRNDVVVGETLGGAASFISNVLDGVSIRCDLVSKVGSDFAYSVAHPPIVVPTSPTTLFHAFFDSGSDGEGACDRVLKRVRFCGAIEPSDLPESRFNFGMAVGVAGEILPETLERMLDICEVVFVDIQALIRVFDSSDGTVRLVGLKGSGFFHLLPRIGFLKASAEEAPYVDVEEARKWCCVLITNGKEGCTLYWKDGEMQISPFPTVQIDPTGAGDSFLGGFVAGLVQGLAVPDAALLGNLFGSMTVGQIGLPKFELRLLQVCFNFQAFSHMNIVYYGSNSMLPMFYIIYYPARPSVDTMLWSIVRFILLQFALSFFIFHPQSLWLIVEKATTVKFHNVSLLPWSFLTSDLAISIS